MSFTRGSLCPLNVDLRTDHHALVRFPRSKRPRATYSISLHYCTHDGIGDSMICAFIYSHMAGIGLHRRDIAFQ